VKEFNTKCDDEYSSVDGAGGRRNLSISMIFSTEEDSNKGDVMRFSTANTTPYMRAMSEKTVLSTAI